MALSEKALHRKDMVRIWVQSQLQDTILGVYADESNKGRVTRHRIWMIGALALSREYGIPLKHVFEDDEHWKIVEREMRLHSSTFYNHVNYSQWDEILNPNRQVSIFTNFYRSKVHQTSTYDFVHPELVLGFPTFTALEIDIGTTNADYPKDAVLNWLGMVGGTATHDKRRTGRLGFSNDTSWSELIVTISGYRRSVNYDGIPGTEIYVVTTGDTGFVEVNVVPTDPTTRVEIGGDVMFTDGVVGRHVSKGFKMIAEDDTEVTYEILVYDRTN